MILYNTTFHIDSAIDSDFIAWLKKNFIAAATDHGFERAMLTRLIDRVEPGCTSYALHLYADGAELVDRWETDKAQLLMQEMYDKWGERALAFPTAMEVIDIND